MPVLRGRVPLRLGGAPAGGQCRRARAAGTARRQSPRAPPPGSRQPPAPPRCRSGTTRPSSRRASRASASTTTDRMMSPIAGLPRLAGGRSAGCSAVSLTPSILAPRSDGMLAAWTRTSRPARRPLPSRSRRTIDLALRVGEVVLSSGAGAADVAATTPCGHHVCRVARLRGRRQLHHHHRVVPARPGHVRRRPTCGRSPTAGSTTGCSLTSTTWSASWAAAPSRGPRPVAG